MAVGPNDPRFLRVATGIDVSPLLAQIDAQPELWDQHSQRRTHDGSPHSAMRDIWVRYRAFDELTSPAAYGEPHFATFYPAWNKLPALRPIVFGLMAQAGAVYLGGILITRIPPGGKILPHHDRGSWHAEFHNAKVYVPLRSNSRCVNTCEDQSAVMMPGEAWYFDNLRTHSVENNGDQERITLIISMRVEG